MEKTYLYYSCRDNIIHIKMLWWLSIRLIYYWYCHILDKLQYGDNLMADKGFNISDLLRSKGSQLIIPSFWERNNDFQREKQRFSKKTEKRHWILQKPEGACWASNCTDKGLPNFDSGIFNNHEGLTRQYIFNLCC